MSSFVLKPKGPFSLARSADVVENFPPLAHQPRPSNGEIRLGFVLDRTHESVAVCLSQPTGSVHVKTSATKDPGAVARQVARIFSLDQDATAYPKLAKRDPKLGPLMRRFEGLRPVCFTSPYEAACWAIISQRIHKPQAAKIVAELVRAHGEVVALGEERVRVFPRPDRLLDVRTVPGLPELKLARLRVIATAALEGKLDAESLRAMGDERAVEALKRLPGIGPFWASGIYLRACGVADVFPDEPLSLAALAALHGLENPSADRIEALVGAYRPFRMWACFLLRVAAARQRVMGC